MTIDSNILIRYLNGDEAVIRALTDWFAAGRPLTVSTISLAEVLAWGHLTSAQMKIARGFLTRFLTIPVSAGIAYAGAELKRNHRLTLTDALIAATALEFDLPLVTRDEDFQRVDGLRVITI